MARSVHTIVAAEVRRTHHPVFEAVEKYWMTVRAADFPAGISHKANARDPVGLNRRVYREVRESLEGKSSLLGTFDMMNKGITILATKVVLVDKATNTFEIEIDDDEGGIVDGAHTAKIIEESNSDGTTPAEQHVEVYIRTGLKGELVTDIARGLNTGIQVAPKSIYNLDGVFDWLKDEVRDKPYRNQISWTESDEREYDARDLVGILELLNVIDFPNDAAGKHPISAYEKWSVPLDKFAKDWEAHKSNRTSSTYYRLRGLLPGGLALYDRIRRDFRDMHNQAGGQAGKMNIIEKASVKRKVFDFPFGGLEPCEYRLTKGAAFPIVAAFRNFVVVDDITGRAEWKGGFDAVLRAWTVLGPELVAETFSTTREIGNTPDLVGKNRKHWDNLHMKVQLRLLRAELEERKSEDTGRTARTRSAG